MDNPSTRFDQQIQQSPLWSWYFAWEAVNDETTLEEYLRYRLCVYIAKGRRSFHPLEFDIAIINGRIVLTPNPAYKPYWEELLDDSVGDRGVQFMSRNEQEEIAQALDRIQAEQGRIDARRSALDEDIEKLTMDGILAISEDKEPGETTLARHERQRGKQQLPFPWPVLFGYLAIAFLVLVETFQVTGPFLDLTGVDSGNLGFDFARSPISVLGGVALAISATVGLMLGWHVVMRSAVELATRWETAGPLRCGGKLIGLLSLCLFLGIFTFAIAYLRHSTTGDAGGLQDGALSQNAVSHTGTIVFLCLTILMPAAAAYVQQQIAASFYWKLRADFQAEQARQDQAEDQLLRRPNQRADALARLESERAKLALEQERVDASRKAIDGRVRAAQRERNKTLDDARQAAKAYAQTLVAALEIDRYSFVRFARRCKPHLIPAEAPCPPRESTSAPVTEDQSASSGAEAAPVYRVRPMLNGSNHRDEP